MIKNLKKFTDLLGVEPFVEFDYATKNYTAIGRHFDKFGNLKYTNGLGKECIDDINVLKLLDCTITLSKPQKPTLSQAERVILENLDKKWKWIARDYEGDLTLLDSKGKPEKSNIHRIYLNPENGDIFSAFYIYNHLFQFIQFDKNGCYEIAELLRED